ncbi:hypothetical protein HYH03_014373 [Edaphochlamys debaryana]|uniref:Protein kinase domain-containing protein n=1 Tax=Edaphochlamys debaryana TaxID=47281 RepID=A0A836BS14_9CHLO|nr:hypothetical protein HYH03_014373 [Edaphochlamys debaryana]|eukprot:KAG2487001.1 hypothetical protein HYH03_014373 [Edaphochlamys debaryana]
MAEPSLARLLSLSPNLPQSMERQQWTLHDYHILHTLYSGYAAQVYTATCKYSGVEVVLKVYNDVNKAPDVAQHEMYREVAIQSGLQHNHIEAGTLVLVQEYAPSGDLLGLLHAHGGRCDEATVVQIVLRPLLDALLYLHRWGVVHRDVKPENVLFAGDGSVKLADFGLAINTVEERPVSRVGTLDYMAPEVLRCPVKQSMAMAPGPGDPPRYGFATDVWAVGVVTYELLTGLPPYASECRYQAEARILAAQPPPFPYFLSPMARDFIQRALSPAPLDRPTVRQLLQHPWILDPQACLAQAHAHAHAVAAHHMPAPYRSYGGAPYQPPVALAPTASATSAPQAQAHPHGDPRGPSVLPQPQPHPAAKAQAQAQPHPSLHHHHQHASNPHRHAHPYHPAAGASHHHHQSHHSDPMVLSTSSTLLYNDQRSPPNHHSNGPNDNCHQPLQQQPEEPPATARAGAGPPGSQENFSLPSPNAVPLPLPTMSGAAAGLGLVQQQPACSSSHLPAPGSLAVAANSPQPAAAVRQREAQAQAQVVDAIAIASIRQIMDHDVVDLSKLDLDQIQAMIHKLQQAVALKLSSSSAAAAAGAGLPLPLPTSAALSALGGGDVAMAEVEMHSPSRASHEDSAAASQSACHTPVPAEAAAAAAASGARLSDPGASPAATSTAATPFAAAASLATHILAHPPAGAPPPHANTPSHASAATDYHSLYGSRRTTAEVAPPPPHHSHHVQTSNHHNLHHPMTLPLPLPTTAYPQPHPRSRPATPLTDAVAAALHDQSHQDNYHQLLTVTEGHAHVLGHGHLPPHPTSRPHIGPTAAAVVSAIGAHPQAHARRTAGGSPISILDRSSGGGAHDGDGLVYVSIGGPRCGGGGAAGKGDDVAVSTVNGQVVDVIRAGDDVSLEAARNVAAWLNQLAAM